MKTSVGFLLPLLTLLGAYSSGAEIDRRPSPRALESIRAMELESTVRFLASDEMQGRQAGSRFNRITSQYLAHRFELMGLEPFHRDGYFQYFSLVQGRLTGTNTLQIRRDGKTGMTTAIIHEDFIPSILSESARVEAPLLMAGYGITAPSYGYDDYHGFDAEGRIVLAFAREPAREDEDSRFEGQLDTQYSGERHKIMNAQAHGAVGVMIIQGAPSSSGGDRFSHRARRTWPEDSSHAPFALEAWVEKVRIPAIRISWKLAESILEGTGEDLEDLKRAIDRDSRPRSRVLSSRTEASIETSISRESTRIRNVLAQVRGSDPRGRDEFVVIGAHFDHVGAHGEEVFNGADDNASGTAGLLEIAEAYATENRRPRRSVLFAAWNAEEKGLLGSYYFVDRPPYPLNRTAALLQMDMIGRDEEIPKGESPRFLGLPAQKAEENTNTVHLLGYSRSRDLRRLVQDQNRYIGLDLKLEYDTNASNLLRRSDNWPFLVNGIPALFFHTGLHPDYHNPGDTADKLNYTKMEKVARLVFLSSWELAESDSRPLLDHP